MVHPETPGKDNEWGNAHRQPKLGGVAGDPPLPTRHLLAVSVLITINCFIAWRPLNGAANMAFSLQLVNVICRCSLLLATPFGFRIPYPSSEVSHTNIHSHGDHVTGPLTITPSPWETIPRGHQYRGLTWKRARKLGPPLQGPKIPEAIPAQTGSLRVSISQAAG